MNRPQHAGLRHLALNVRNLEAMKRFYVDVLGFSVEWEPDPSNIYLSSGIDNLALHQAAPDALPQARRNRLAAARYEGRALVVARTGYTGEATGFELFVDAQVALALWQRLVAAGAVAAGLGARDSLRLEAGLPLYGHELGTDRAFAEFR